MKLSLLGPLLKAPSYSKLSDTEKKEFIKTVLRVASTALVLLTSAAYLRFNWKNCIVSTFALSLFSLDAASMLMSSFFFHAGNTIIYSAITEKSITVKSALMAAFAFRAAYSSLYPTDLREDFEKGVLEKHLFNWTADRLV